jgi:hypothetical protein
VGLFVAFAASACQAISGIDDLRLAPNRPDASEPGADTGVHADGSSPADVSARDGDASSARETGEAGDTGTPRDGAEAGTPLEDGGTDSSTEAGVVGIPCSTAGALRCVDHAQTLRLVCDATTLRWVPTTSCPDGQLCDTTDAACRPIVPACSGRMPGEAFCNGAARVVCGPDLVTSSSSTCKSAEHCRLGTGALCAVCIDTEFVCEGTDLKSCAADHQSFVHKDTCTTAAPCNAAAGACTTAFCLPNQYNCMGDTLQKCNATQTAFEKVADCQPGMCSAQRQHCDTCVPTSKTCANGTTVSTCQSDGTTTSPAACPTGTPYCVNAGLCVACTMPSQCPKPANECLAAACTNNSCGTSPVAANTPLIAQTAGDCKTAVCNGSGGTTSATATSDVPVDGNPCTRDVCTGSTPSNPNENPGTVCNTTGVCNGNGVCGVCVPGTPRCTGNTAENCNANGQWSSQACSAPTPVCSGGVCYACNLDGDCPAPAANPCKQRKCTNHVCGFANVTGGCSGSGTCSGGLCQRPAITVGSYNVDPTEVTRGQYAAFVAAKNGNTSGQPVSCSQWNTTYVPELDWPPSGDEDKPVAWIDWCDAYAYCAWAGRRLCGKIGGGPNLTSDYDNPALSQWMHACSGPSNFAFPYGSTYNPTRCNGSEAGVNAAAAVTTFTQCNGGYSGIYDMSGNVWEWEDSCAAAVGPDDFCRVRGSSYYGPVGTNGVFLQCNSNNNNPRSATDSTIGFRCCGP